MKKNQQLELPVAFNFNLLRGGGLLSRVFVGVQSQIDVHEHGLLAQLGLLLAITLLVLAVIFNGASRAQPSWSSKLRDLVVPSAKQALLERQDDVVHFELELFDSARHFVSLVLGLLNDVVDLVPVQLIGNGIVDDEDGTVDLERSVTEEI